MATPESKYIYQLVTVQDTGEAPTSIAFGDSTDQDYPLYADWDTDGNGHIRTIAKEDAMLQTTLKCLFTEKQAGGYGAGLYDFIGVKDVAARRLSVFLDVTFAVMRLKSILNAIASSQNLADSDRILSVQKLSVVEDETNPTQMNVGMALKHNDGTLTNVGIL